MQPAPLQNQVRHGCEPPDQGSERRPLTRARQALLDTRRLYWLNSPPVWPEADPRKLPLLTRTPLFTSRTSNEPSAGRPNRPPRADTKWRTTRVTELAWRAGVAQLEPPLHVLVIADAACGASTAAREDAAAAASSMRLTGLFIMGFPFMA